MSTFITMNGSGDLDVRLGRLLLLARGFARGEGVNPTSVDFLSVARHDRPTLPAATVMSPAFCLVLEGKKIVSLGERSVLCGPGNFLASAIDIPASIHIEGATPQRPYLGLIVRFATEEIADLVAESGQRPTAPAQGDVRDFVGVPYAEFLDVLERIMRLGASESDQFRAKLAKRELIFCLLASRYGHLFAPKAVFDEKSGVLHAVTWIRTNFARDVAIDQLAARFHMSPSSLQHKFKAATAMSPIQFQKQLRLQEARRLLLAGRCDVGSAAFAVGYASLSHFTRDYARLFGITPGREVRTVRAPAAPADTVLSAAAFRR